jgi:methionyl aminopeptidase
MSFDEKLTQCKNKGYKIPTRKMIKNQEQLDGIRESGKVNIAVLDYVAEHIQVGMSTEEIDRMVYEKTLEYNGIPAPLNFEGYPKSVCTSINEEVCHGIPSKDIILKDGDIVNVDVSTIYKDYFSDSSRMFCLGNVSSEKQKLVDDTKKAIELGLSYVKPWHRIGEMGNAIYEFAREHGYSVVREVGGHGVGIEFHEEPFVSYCCPKESGVVMVPGMVFTIEPMINLGRSDIVMDDENGWTIYTEDGMPSAQWEVTVAVTEDGYEIMAY